MDTLICENPEKGADNSQKVYAKIAEFGDGYTQRAYSGINAIKQVRSLTWTLSTEKAQELYEFLKIREQVVAFRYTYPGDIERSYVCSDLKYQDKDPAPSTVSATFTEVFDI